MCGSLTWRTWNDGTKLLGVLPQGLKPIAGIGLLSELKLRPLALLQERFESNRLN